MKRIFIAFFAFMTSVTLASAGPGYNGPVTINGKQIYYFTGTWNQLAAGIGSGSLSGLPNGTYTLPWAGINSTSAADYAQKWRDAAVTWPVDSADQYPNSAGSITPYFVWAAPLFSPDVYWAADMSDNTDITGQNPVGTVYSYALAVSQ